jgi:hypothetical protein
LLIEIDVSLERDLRSVGDLGSFTDTAARYGDPPGENFVTERRWLITGDLGWYTLTDTASPGFGIIPWFDVSLRGQWYQNESQICDVGLATECIVVNDIARAYFTVQAVRSDNDGFDETMDEGLHQPSSCEKEGDRTVTPATLPWFVPGLTTESSGVAPTATLGVDYPLLW